MSTHGIHHVTAISAHIAQNKQYYTETLGLRLVKKSVNQDDVSAYHLFYADGEANPGTDMTFFDWPNIPSNVPGAGEIAGTAFRVPKESLDFWETRLADAGSLPDRQEGRILFGDPEGQRLELVADLGWPNQTVAWEKYVPVEHAIQGILGVTLNSARPDGTRRVLTEFLGYEEVSEGLFQVKTDASFSEVRMNVATGAFARQGAGGTHHVAFRVKDDESLLALQEKVEQAGIKTSGFVDRFWFHSLYFREPSGILFEIATDGPGFAVDEDPQHLGEKLVLPPFLEGRRASIEAGLKPIE